MELWKILGLGTAGTFIAILIGLAFALLILRLKMYRESKKIPEKLNKEMEKLGTEKEKEREETRRFFEDRDRRINDAEARNFIKGPGSTQISNISGVEKSKRKRPVFKRRNK